MRCVNRLLGLGLASVFLSVPALAAAPAAWAESAMVKVRSGASAQARSELRLTAARNEFVSFQVALHGGDAGLRGVRASLASLDGPSRIAGTDVTLYREAYVTTKQPSVKGEPVGAWPDGLVPDRDEIAGEARKAFPFDVPAGEARAVWVDVRVPENAPAGDYVGEVTVTADGGFTSRVTVRLAVVDAALPSTPALASAFLLWPPHVCNAHFGRTDCTPAELEPLLTRYQRMALEHRITLSGPFPRSPWAPDWAAFDATWGPFLEGTAPTRLPGAKATTLEYVGPLTASALADFTAHVRARGWLDRAYAQVGDEPPYGASFEDVRAHAELVRQSAPGLRTLLTTNSAELANHSLEDLVDVAVPLVNHLDGTEAPYVGDQRGTYAGFLARPGRQVWAYQSCMSHGCAYGTNAPENKPGAGWPSYMLDRSAAKARAMEWVSFLEGATGELYYQTVGMLPTAWTDQYRFNGNGDGTLFYPGTVAAIGGSTAVPVASIRLKLIRQGVQDYEWLTAVSRAGDPAFARKVARELIPAASRVPDDGAAFDAARLRLIQRYQELTGASTPTPPATGDANSGGTPTPVTPPATGGTASGGSTPTPAPTGTVPSAAVDAPSGGCSAGGGGGTAMLAGLLVLGAWWSRGARRARVRVPVRMSPRRRRG
ncbi:DUF4091 domain-containing protein [Corallococcus sp. M34]|nr:DUF4091 domain-containing protein [Citreicoccus inhibens]